MKTKILIEKKKSKLMKRNKLIEFINFMIKCLTKQKGKLMKKTI